MIQDNICLKSQIFVEDLFSSIGKLKDNAKFTDVTLVCEDGLEFVAHSMVLASTSPLFYNILSSSKEHVFIQGISSNILCSILDWIYFGKATISEEDTHAFISCGRELQFKGFDNELDESINTWTTNKDLDTKVIKTDTVTEIAKSEEIQETEKNYANSIAIVASFSGIQKLDNDISKMMERNQEWVKSKLNRKEWKCKVCGKSGMKVNIVDHIEAKHMDGVSHACFQCGINFR